MQTTNSVNESEYLRSKSFLDLVFSRFCMFCAYIRPRYQVSVYRTIGPLVSVFETTALLNLQYFPLAPFAISYRVTNEALIAETVVWPTFFLSYEFFLCSKFFYSYCQQQ